MNSELALSINAQLRGAHDDNSYDEELDAGATTLRSFLDPHRNVVYVDISRDEMAEG